MRILFFLNKAWNEFKRHLEADSALACEGDVRRDLLANIVLTGVSSVIPGLHERLQYDLGDSILPVGCKARISAASEAERTN